MEVGRFKSYRFQGFLSSQTQKMTILEDFGNTVSRYYSGYSLLNVFFLQNFRIRARSFVKFSRKNLVDKGTTESHLEQVEGTHKIESSKISFATDFTLSVRHQQMSTFCQH